MSRKGFAGRAGFDHPFFCPGIPAGYFGMVLGIIALPLFLFSNAIIGLLLARTIILLLQGKLIMREALSGGGRT